MRIHIRAPLQRAPRFTSLPPTSLLFCLAINTAGTIVFLRTGAADALWRHIAPEVPWRTGPAWSATMLYAVILFVLHALISLPFARRQNKGDVTLYIKHKGDQNKGDVTLYIKGDVPFILVDVVPFISDVATHGVKFVAG